MKEFNTTGVCIPKKHYMVDISNKLDQLESLVERGKYFTINRPRQYGKTTTMYLLSKRLEKKNYLVIKLSFEGFDKEIYKNQSLFIEEFILAIMEKLELQKKYELIDILKAGLGKTNNMRSLSRLLTAFAQSTNYKIILMIDEVDKSSNNQLFLDFIAMLRNKFLLREQNEDKTFHSVILAGIYDVKNLKLKLRDDEEKKYNSPWNIAVDFDIEMDFNPKEIATMLKSYQKENTFKINVPKIADKLYYYTSGYPYLVSKLCQIIDEKIINKDKKLWTEKDIEKAVKIILNISSVNFDSLIKNLENNQDLYELVYDLIVEGLSKAYNIDNPVIEKGVLYGIFDNDNGFLKIHNRIYEQRIYNYMISKIETNIDMNFYNYTDNFLTDEGYLDFEKVLEKFQLFIKEEYSDKDIEFLERNGRLVFLAFIKPIINGKGFDFKEVQTSQEKRLDVVITYLDKKHIVELKVWRGEKYHQKGLEQLSDYLERQNVDKGYLLCFDFNQNKEYKQERIKLKDKEIYAVWV
ncbi:AAA-like domain-containing protein [Natronospora cellulosivora (SeqCode)]